MIKVVQAGEDINAREAIGSQSHKTQDENAEEVGPSASTDHPLSCETAPKSKFASLQFRAKLKARGRPKRAERQLCFFN